MFTHRICCCSATVASQVMAIIAIVMGALLALSNWLDGTNIYLDITQTVIVVIELIACILVFVAVCTIRPVFMIPIIVIMGLNAICIIGFAIWDLIALWSSLTVWGIVWLISVYVLSLLINAFVLHCHTCCYKLLIVKRHAHNHHTSAAHYTV